MYQPKLEKDIRCPLEYGLDVFGGKWKSRIICVLANQGTLRYGELRTQMANITDAVLAQNLKELAVLAQNLKELMTDGMISRKQYQEIPLRVEYSLTAKGSSVVPILQSICSWAGAYHREISEYSMAQCKKCDYTRLPPGQDAARAGRRQSRTSSGQDASGGRGPETATRLRAATQSPADLCPPSGSLRIRA